MTKRVLHALEIGKIAAVDFPCQEHATAVIMKRRGDGWKAPLQKKLTLWHGDDGKLCVEHDTTPGAVVGKAICAAIKKAGIGLNDADGDEGAQDFDAVLGEQKLTQDFWDAFYKGTSALQSSLVSILKDDAVEDKAPMVTQSLKEFSDYIEGILPGEIGKCLAAGIVAKFAGGAGINPDGGIMSEAVKKALGLPATATEAEVLAKMQERDAALAKAQADAAVGALSDVEKAYHGWLPEAERAPFLAKADKAKAMKDKPMPKDKTDPECDADVEKAIAAGDAFRTPDGLVVLKSKLGPEQFAIMKSLHKRAADAEKKAEETDKVAKALNEEKIAKGFEEKAEGMGFAKVFGATLRKAYSGDAAAQAEVEKQMRALRTQAEQGGVFKELGGNGAPDAGSAGAELYAKRDALMKADPNLKPEQAFARVYKARDNAAIVKRFKEEQARTN